MAILFHSSEDLDFYEIGGGGGSFNSFSSYTRTRNRVAYQTPGLDTPGHDIRLDNYINSGYISSIVSHTTTPYSALRTVYRIYKDDTLVFKIFHNSNYGFSIGYYNGSNDVELSTPIPDAPIALTAGKEYNLVVYFDFSNINNAIVRVYLDNMLAAQWEGDASVFTSDGNINRIRMYGFSIYTYWSEFIVSDKDTNLLNHGVASFIPYADGTDTEFTGTYADIDEVAIDDNDYIFSDTPGQKQSFNFKTLLDVDDETIEKLALSARVKMVEGSGITNTLYILFRCFIIVEYNLKLGD